MGELALVREAGVRGDLRQGEVAAALQELLRPFDAAHDEVLVRRQPGGRLELPGEMRSWSSSCKAPSEKQSQSEPFRAENTSFWKC
jgi:hypothetical protein